MNPEKLKHKVIILWPTKLRKTEYFFWLAVLAIIFTYSCLLCVGFYKINKFYEQTDKHRSNYEQRILRIEALHNLETR